MTASSRPNKHSNAVSTFTMVPATVYDAVPLKPDSKVRITEVAKRAMQTWSPNKQRALIKRLSSPDVKADALPAGYKVLRMGDGGRVIFSKKSGKVVVEHVLDRGFGPEL